MARDSARIIPVRIPGNAIGSTSRCRVCHLVAPTPSPASRIDGGTALIASCDDMITMGRISSASVAAPASTLRPNAMARTKTASPNTP